MRTHKDALSLTGKLQHSPPTYPARFIWYISFKPIQKSLSCKEARRKEWYSPVPNKSPPPPHIIFFDRPPILNFPLFFNGNKLGNEKTSKLRGQTGSCQSSLQKLIFGNNCQNAYKSRYQSFLVLPNFAWFSYVRWNVL